MKFDEKWAQKIIYNHSKPEARAPTGWVVLIWGVRWRRLFVAVVGSGKKSAKSLETYFCFWSPNPKTWFLSVGLAECTVLLERSLEAKDLKFR